MPKPKFTGSGVNRFSVAAAASREGVRADFATVASHQLRTPIAIIRWALDMVLTGRSGRLTIKQREYLDRAYQQNVFMARIVGDLLRISRIEEGGIIIVGAPFNLAGTVRSVVREEMVLAKASNCAISVLAPRRPARVVGDEIKIKQAIQVLVDNAIRYSKREGRVEVRLRAKQNQWELAVRDHGIGIPVSQQKHIFTKFFRAENAIHSQTEGLGIELYIAKSYLEAMGGRLSFTSSVRRGTTFTISLPRRRLKGSPLGGRKPTPWSVTDEMLRLSQHLIEPVVMLDPAFRVVGFNESAKVLLRMNEEYVGRYLGDVVASPDLRNLLKQRLFSEETLMTPLRLPGDDRLTPFRLLLLPLRKQDVIIGWTFVVQEAYMRHRADVDAVERIRREREFVSLTVHELNGPLSANKWSLEMLRHKSLGKLSHDQRQLMDQIYRNNERQLVLVRDMLNVAKLQQGRFQVNLQPVNLSIVMRDVLRSFHAAARTKNIRLQWTGGKRHPKVRADAGRIAQVLTNLISNAVKYTPTNGRVTVGLRYLRGPALVRMGKQLKANISNADAPRGYVVCSVRDTGIGIPPQQLRKVFTIFFRSQEALKAKIAGTGMGLFIAKAIIELHKGDIWYQSKFHKGSVFCFSLPVA